MIYMENLELKDGEAILLVGTRRVSFDASDVPCLEAMVKHLATESQLADFFDSIALPKKLDAANAKLKRKRRTRTRAEIDADKAAESAAWAGRGAALAAAMIARSKAAAEAIRPSEPRLLKNSV